MTWALTARLWECAWQVAGLEAVAHILLGLHRSLVLFVVLFGLHALYAKVLAEMARVLRPGGRLVALATSRAAVQV